MRRGNNPRLFLDVWGGGLHFEQVFIFCGGCSTSAQDTSGILPDTTKPAPTIVAGAGLFIVHSKSLSIWCEFGVRHFL